MRQRSDQSFSRPTSVLHAAETGIGGINSVIIQLGSSQVARFGRERVDVLVPRDHADGYADAGLSPHTFSRNARGLRSSLVFAWSLARLVLGKRPTFVFLHSSLAGLIGRLVLLCLRPVHRPIVVYCAHCWAFTMGTSALRRTAFAWVERGLARLASVIVNVSDAEQEAAVRAGLPEGRMRCIPNGTPRAPTRRGLTPYASCPEALNLLFVGRLDRQKGIDLLLAVLSENPELPVHLTVVGSAVVEGADTQRLPNVTYIDWLRREDLAPYYAHADAVVVPSRWEGLPLVAAEALSFGTPVVASRVGGLTSLVEDGVSGFLFDAESAVQLHAILAGLDRTRLRAMRPAALRRWEAVADLEVMNRRYLELMQTLVEAGRRDRAPGVAAGGLEGRAQPDATA
jgi:glycosyltransferase involved in cell wall biosynthesis